MNTNWLTKILSTVLIITLAFAFLPLTSVRAAAIESTQSGAWNDTATWFGGVIPVSTDSVTIKSSHIVTLAAATEVVSLTIENTAVLNTTLSGFDLTITGDFTNNGTFTANGSNVIIAGTAATQSIAGFTTTGEAEMTKTSGTATITGGISADGLIINGAGGTLNLGSGSHTFTSWTNTTGTLNNGTSTLTINAPASFSGGTLTGGGTIVLKGNFANGGTFDTLTANVTITDTAATQSIAGFTTTGTVSMTKASGTATFAGNVNGGALTINGAAGTLKLDAGVTGLTHTFTGTWTRTAGTLDASKSTLNLNGTPTAFSGTGGFTPGTSTVNYGAAGTQTMMAETYYNLTTSGGDEATHIKSIGGTIIVNGTLTVGTGSTLDTVLLTLTANGPTVVNGTLKHTSATGTKTFNGNVTINNGGTWNATAAEAFTIVGNLQNDGTFTASSGLYTFSGSGKTFSGANTISIPSAAITGSYTNNGTLTVGTALSGAGALTQATGSTLNIGGTSTITNLDASTNVNTVNYTGATQTVKPVAYHHLGLSGSAIKTLTSITTINGNLSISGSASATTGAAFTIGGDLDISSTTAALTVGAFNFTVTGNTLVTGDLIYSSATGTKTHTGNVTINSGGIWDDNNFVIPITFNGNLQNDGTFTAGTGVHTFNGAAKTFSGTGVIAIPNTTITGSYTNNGTLTVTTSLTGAGSLTQGAASSLSIGAIDANFTLATLEASAVGNTVNYTLAGVQTVKPIIYHHLTLSGSGVKTTTGITVNGMLSMEGTATASALPVYGSDAKLQYKTGALRTVGIEWPATFSGTGGVFIDSGAFVITMNEAKVVTGSLTIDTSAKLANGGFGLNLGGDFINNGGTFTATTTAPVSVSGNLLNNSGTFTSGSAVINVTGNLTNGGTITTVSGSNITVNGDFTNNNTFTASTSVGSLITLGGSLIRDTDVFTLGATAINLTGTQTTNIAGFTTTGAVSMLKTGGTATLISNVIGGALTINGTGGTLNLGTGLTHTFTGTWTRTAGTLNGSSSTLALKGTTVSGISGTFVPETGTVHYTGNIQDVAGETYYHLTMSRLSGTAAVVKTLKGNLTVNGGLIVNGGTSFSIGAFDITVEGTSTVGGTLTHSSSIGTKIYKGMVTVSGAWLNTGNAAFNFQGGLTNNGSTFTAGTAATAVYTFSVNPQIIGGTKATTITTILVDGITLTNNNTLGLTISTALSDGTGAGTLTQGVGAILNLGGISNISTMNAEVNPNTVNYTKAGAQTVKPIIYHHLGLSGGNVKDITGLSTVNGNLTLTTSTTSAITTMDLNIGGNLVINAATTFTVHTFDIIVAGTTTLNGTLVHNNDAGNTKRYTGMVTIGGTTGKWTNSGDVSINFRGGLTNNSTASPSFTAGTGTYTFDTNAQDIGGANALIFQNMAIDGVTVTNKNRALTIGVTAGNTLSGNGTLTQGTSASCVAATGCVINIGLTDVGASTVNLVASVNPNTVNYNLANVQTIKAATYHHLSLSGSNTKTFPAGTTINGNFSISGTAIVTLTADLNVPGNLTLAAGTLNASTYNINVGGNWTKNAAGVFTSTGAGKVTFNGSSALLQQSIGGAVGTVFNNLTINNTGIGVKLVTVSPSINGDLNLIDGTVTTSTFVVVVNKDGTLTGGNADSYVIGNLRKVFYDGAAPDFIFALGDTAGYRPLTIQSLNVAGPTTDIGFITATIPTTPTEHVSVATSGINSAQDVNRYWKLTTGGGITFTGTFNATFGFENDQYDLLADPLTFVVRKYQNTTAPTGWSAPTLGTVTANSIEATGFTSIGVSSDFVVGQLPPTAVTEVSEVDDIYGNTVSLSAKLTGVTPLNGHTITFAFNGVPIAPSATTNELGVATLSTLLDTDASLTTYTGGVTAEFAATNSFAGSIGSADLTVAKRPITVTAVTDTKEFDNSNTSAGVPTITVNGPLVTGDTVTWTQTFDASYATIGTGKTMTPAGTISDGNSGNNYDVTFATVATGEITTKALTVSGLSVTDKDYDGTTTASISGIPTLNGLVTGFTTVNVSGVSGAFEDENAGTVKNVTVTGTLSGTHSAYYTLSPLAASTADINAINIELTAATNTKPYDGTTSSVGVVTQNTGTLIAGDTLIQTFDTKDVGTGKTLTPSVDDGFGGGNYIINAHTNTTGVISTATLTITADNKVAYLGGTAPSYTYTPSGFTGGESFLSLGFTAPTCSTGAAFNTYALGNHPGVITCSGGVVSSNYTIGYTAGNLQIVDALSVTYTSTGGYDGWVLGAPLNLAGGSLNNTAYTFNLGDNTNNRQYRGILHFNTSGLPNDAIVTSVVLKIKKAGLIGKDPFMTHGSVFVNMTTPDFGAVTLENTDFEAVPSLPTIAAVVDETPINSWYSANFTNTAKAAVNLIGTTQLKLRFSRLTDNNFTSNYIQFYSGNSTAADRPQLIINYYTP